MTMKRTIFVSVCAALCIVIGCSGSSGSIGSACSGDDECTNVTTASQTGFCSSGVCTRDCSSNGDCGCAAGSEPQDHTCNVACVGSASFATGMTVCTALCASDADCNGSTSCKSVNCNGVPCGYSVCD